MTAVADAVEIADALRGTSLSLQGVLTDHGMESAENDTAFCARLDAEVFCCEVCEWWCDTSEMSARFEDRIMCDDCASEVPERERYSEQTMNTAYAIMFGPKTNVRFAAISTHGPVIWTKDRFAAEKFPSAERAEAFAAANLHPGSYRVGIMPATITNGPDRPGGTPVAAAQAA